jgi:hypothetical protein
LEVLVCVFACFAVATAISIAAARSSNRIDELRAIS